MKNLYTYWGTRDIYQQLDELSRRPIEEDKKFVGYDDSNRLHFSDLMTKKFAGRCVKLADLLNGFIESTDEKIKKKNSSAAKSKKLNDRRPHSIEGKVLKGSSISKCSEISTKGCLLDDFKKVLANFKKILEKEFPVECGVRGAGSVRKVECPDSIKKLSRADLKRKCGAVINVYKRIESLRSEVDSGYKYVEMDQDNNVKCFNSNVFSDEHLSNAINLNYYIYKLIADFRKAINSAGLHCSNSCSELRMAFDGETGKCKDGSNRIYETEMLFSDLDCMEKIFKRCLPEELLPLFRESNSEDSAPLIETKRKGKHTEQLATIEESDTDSDFKDSSESESESEPEPEPEQGSSRLFQSKQRRGKKRKTAKEKRCTVKKPRSEDKKKVALEYSSESVLSESESESEQDSSCLFQSKQREVRNRKKVALEYSSESDLSESESESESE